MHHHYNNPKKQLQNISIPSSEDGLIPTLNSYGYMLEKPDVISQEFIQYVGSIKGLALDIGSAYGVSVISALQNGATVIANDLDERHLQILVQNTPCQLKQNLTILQGKFPSEVNIQAGSLDGVLSSGVLHYLTGEELEIAFQKIFNILKA